MPFTFKLSKRLALIKAALAASAVLALACERADLTNPQPLPSAGPEPGPTATIIFQDGFESGNLSAWAQDQSGNKYTVTANRVKSGTRSLEVLYSANASGYIAKWFMPGYDEIYVKFNVMYEENFDERNGNHFFTICGNHVNTYNSCFGRAGSPPNGYDYFYAGLDPEYIQGDPLLKPFHFYTYYPGMTCCYGNRFFQTSPKTALTPGQWQQVVMHVKMNTPGQSNGRQALWINGVKKIDQPMRWRNTTDLKLNLIRLDNWMSAVPKTERVWMDDVVVWRP
jgi:hypothetical protein